jgi:hypothetical protein
LGVYVMVRNMEKRIKIGLSIFIIGIMVIAGGLYLINQVQSGKFGIYLLKNNELVISDEDIVWYENKSYDIKLTDKGARKIQTLQVGVYGEPFSIKIGNEEIYNGSFWTPISSISYHGIVIETLVDDNTIQLEKGYQPNSYKGIDPRADTRIDNYFRKIGKLRFDSVIIVSGHSILAADLAPLHTIR